MVMLQGAQVHQVNYQNSQRLLVLLSDRQRLPQAVDQQAWQMQPVSGSMVYSDLARFLGKRLRSRRWYRP